MNAQLEKLIDLALADGVLTEKEKQVLYKKAKELNVDQDEFEMVLQAKIYLASKSFTQQSPPEVNDIKTSQKEGSVRKCPACGSAVNAFHTRCEDCGHEFRNISNARVVDELMRRLEEAEQEALISKPKRDYVGSFQRLLDSEEYKTGRIMDAKSKVISAFPVPNTKEDFLEILSLALSQVTAVKVTRFEKLLGTTSGSQNYRIRYHQAWKALSEKIIVKSRFSMRNDEGTLREIERYARQLGIK